MSVNDKRFVPDRLHGRGYRMARSWESLLIVVVIAVFIINSFASPYFLDAWNLSDATFNFTEKAMIAFAMALLIIAGEIDLSEIITHRGDLKDGPDFYKTFRDKHDGCVKCVMKPEEL